MHINENLTGQFQHRHVFTESTTRSLCHCTGLLQQYNCHNAERSLISSTLVQLLQSNNIYGHTLLTLIT